MSTPLFAIPCHGLPPEGAQQALDRTLALLAGFGVAVHVFRAPGQGLALPPEVREHELAAASEPPSALPAGWLAAAGKLRRHTAHKVLFVHPANPNLTAARVAEALERLAAPETEVLLSVAPCRDHPCQWQEYLDILASQTFAPVEAEATEASRAVAVALGLSASGQAGHFQASVPFRMPASAPWPQGFGAEFKGDAGTVFEWLRSSGQLVPVAAGLEHSGAALEARVFLHREEGIFVRQVVCCRQALAAMPLLRPVGDAPACFLRQPLGADWLMGAGAEILAATRTQLFPLPSERQPENLEASLALRHQVLGTETYAVADGVFRAAGTVPPQTGSPVFLLNALAPAELPQADIALPFTSASGGWELDYRVMAAVNSATGKLIHGRQSFPDVLELEGSLLGFSAPALRSPVAALGALSAQDGGKTAFIVVEEQERLPEDACAALAWSEPPWSAPGRGDQAVYAPPGGPVGGPADGLADGPEPEFGVQDAPESSSQRLTTSLLAAVAIAQSELALARAAFADAQADQRTAARPHCEEALAALAELRRLHAALTFESALVGRQLREIDLGMELLPLRIHTAHWGKLLSLLPEFFERKVLPGLLETLLGLWEQLCAEQPDATALTRAALAAMREYALKAALPACWAEGLPLLLARRNMTSEARLLLDEQYRLSPWLQDEYSRIAVECFRPHFRFDEYVQWLECDALAGRMSPLWLYHYCEGLAVSKREEQALALTAAAYVKQPKLCNYYANIAIWRFATRDFDPARALPIFELDHRAGRLAEAYAPQYAGSLAYTGQLERACDTVARAYAKDVAVNNGYAVVGWYHHYLLQRDARAALTLFAQDEAQGRLEPSWRAYQAALQAFLGDMDTAERMVLEIYGRSPLHCDCLAQLGVAHWLAHRDTALTLDFFRRDEALGRLRSMDMLLLGRAFAALAAGGGAGGGGGGGVDAAGQAVPEAMLAHDLCVARLGLLGYRPEDVRALMSSDLRDDRSGPAAASRDSVIVE